MYPFATSAQHLSCWQRGALTRATPFMLAVEERKKCRVIVVAFAQLLARWIPIRLYYIRCSIFVLVGLLAC